MQGPYASDEESEASAQTALNAASIEAVDEAEVLSTKIDKHAESPGPAGSVPEQALPTRTLDHQGTKYFDAGEIMACTAVCMRCWHYWVLHLRFLSVCCTIPTTRLSNQPHGSSSPQACTHHRLRMIDQSSAESSSHSGQPFTLHLIFAGLPPYYCASVSFYCACLPPTDDDFSYAHR